MSERQSRSATLQRVPHPHSPAGRQFDWASLGVPHPHSPAGRQFDWQAFGVPHPSAFAGQQFDWSSIDARYPGSPILRQFDPSEPAIERVFTREDAARLIDESEGDVIDPAKPEAIGHSQAHVGTKETPAMDLPGRRSLTTMYRNRTQAEKDLRDVLNRYSRELRMLPPDGVLKRLTLVSEPRQVKIAEPSKAFPGAATSIKTTTRQKVFVKIVKSRDGSLHLRTMFLTE